MRYRVNPASCLARHRSQLAQLAQVICNSLLVELHEAVSL